MMEPSIALVIKDHQIDGIRHMWNTAIDNIQQAKQFPKGVPKPNGKGERVPHGCVLAHCMGLGKTLQVITLVHAILSRQQYFRGWKVLVLCPKNTLTNWKAEFKRWIPKESFRKYTVRTLAPDEKREDRCVGICSVRSFKVGCFNRNPLLTYTPTLKQPYDLKITLTRCPCGFVHL